MKPMLHAISSAKKFGGNYSDYLEIHDLMDSSKSAHASVKHRSIFHSAFGVFIVEKIFGHCISVQKDSLPFYITTEIAEKQIEIDRLLEEIERLKKPYTKQVSVRDVAELHVIEDLGTLPSLDDYLKCMTVETWMGGKAKKKETTEWKQVEEIKILPREPMYPHTEDPNLPKFGDVKD